MGQQENSPGQTSEASAALGYWYFILTGVRMATMVSCFQVVVEHLEPMKKCLVSVGCLLLGLALGSWIGYRYHDKHFTNEASKQMVESLESSDAFMASVSASAVGLIGSGQNQKAVQTLSIPIARYYYIYASSSFTNEQRLKLRTMINNLASTNQIIAAQIAKEMSSGK